MTRAAVLIIGAGALQVPLIREAHVLGLTVIATDANPQAPGRGVAESFFPIDTYDIASHEALIQALQDAEVYSVRGVVTAGADTAPTVAACAEAAGTPGIPYAVARLTHDKAMVRIALKRAGLQHYQPRYGLVIEGDAWSAVTRIGLPCVVKPRRNRASRGITIVREEAALPAALALAYAHNGEEDTVLLEQCLTGSEHSVEGIFGDDDTLLWFNVVDRIFSYADGLAIETGHINPTRLETYAQHQLLRMLLTTAHALGVHWGPYKMDVMLTADGPKLLECTARLSGGWDCQGTSPLTNRHPMRTLVQLACGLAVEPQPTMAQTDGFAACAAILPQVSGRIVHMPSMMHLPHQSHLGVITEVIWTIGLGDTVAPAAHNAARAGFVLTSARTYREAWQCAMQAAEALAAAVEVDVSKSPP